MPVYDYYGHEPQIFHLHAEYRPLDAAERHALIDRVGQVFHLNGHIPDLLKYYGDLGEGEMQNTNYVRGHVAAHLSDDRKALADCALIYFAPYNYIKVDWKHIYLFSNLLNPERTAKRRKHEVYREEMGSSRSLLGVLTKSGHKMQALGEENDLYKTFDTMSEDEFRIYLEHCEEMERIISQTPMENLREED